MTHNFGEWRFAFSFYFIISVLMAAISESVDFQLEFPCNLIVLDVGRFCAVVQSTNPHIDILKTVSMAILFVRSSLPFIQSFYWDFIVNALHNLAIAFVPIVSFNSLLNSPMYYAWQTHSFFLSFFFFFFSLHSSACDSDELINDVIYQQQFSNIRMISFFQHQNGHTKHKRFQTFIYMSKIRCFFF